MPRLVAPILKQHSENFTQGPIRHKVVPSCMGREGVGTKASPNSVDLGNPPASTLVILALDSVSSHIFAGRCVCMLSHFSRVQLLAPLWTVAHQAPLSMGFSRQEYWSGFPCPPPGDLLNPGMEPRSPALQVDSLLSQQGSPQDPT